MIPTSREIAFIGAPSSAGGRRLGQELAPSFLRGAGLVTRLRANGLVVHDLGDIVTTRFTPDPRNPTERNLAAVLSAARAVEQKVDCALSRGYWPMVAGGDCTVTIGILAAMRKHLDSLGMVYFDGDLDLNTPETTPSGFFDGMGLAHVIGKGTPGLSRFGPRYPLLDEDAVTVFGYSVRAGGIDAAEMALLRDSALGAFSLEDIAGRTREVAKEVVEDLGRRVAHALIHFDVDVIDSADLAAGEISHSPGLNLHDTQGALDVFVNAPLAAAMAVTEFNASGADARQTAAALADLLVSAIGGSLHLAGET